MRQVTRYGSAKAVCLFFIVSQDMPAITAIHVPLAMSNIRVAETRGDTVGDGVTAGC